MGRYARDSHAEGQIDRFIGSVRLDPLPRSLQLKMLDVLNQELGALPASVGAEIKENVIAATALILKASKTDEIYQKEAQRIERQRKTDAIVCQMEQLKKARYRNEQAVEAFEALIYKTACIRHAVLDAAFGTFCAAVSTDCGALLLIEWASKLLTKRKELRP